MFDNAIYNPLKKRVDPYLEPGEDLLSVTMTEAAVLLTYGSNSGPRACTMEGHNDRRGL